MAIWRRIKQSPALNSGTSITVAFDEQTPLDNTHTILAVIQFSGSGANISSISWGAITPLAGSNSSGSALYLGAIAIRGNNSINSLTVNFNSSMSQISMTLYAFDGYSSLTPDTSPVASNNTTLTTSAQVGPTAASIAANTISIAAIGLSADGGTWTGWDSGFTSAPSPLSRLHSGVIASTSAGTVQQSTVNWSSPRASRKAIWTITGTSADGNGTDTTNPAITLTSHSNGATLTGTVDLAGTATDNIAIDRITVSINGEVASDYNSTGVTYNAPNWTVAGFNTQLYTNGSYLITLTAYDAAGNASSTSVTVNINNPTTALPYTPTVLRNSKKLVGGWVNSKKLRKVVRNGVVLFEDDAAAPPTDVTSAPARVASYGPNGTHWPDNTPWFNDSFDSVVVVACSWSAIQTAIANAQTNFPNGKVKILVQPGVLGGNGAGSTSEPVVQNVGSHTRQHLILVCPRDGFGSVTNDGNGISIKNVGGVAFAGFDFNNTGFLWRNCRNVALAWSRIFVLNETANGDNGIDGIQNVEISYESATLRDADRAALRTSGGSANNIVYDGCYLPPAYKNAGSSAHCDTFQVSGSTTSELSTNLVFRDTMLATSSSQCFIGSDATQYVTFDHTLILAGQRGAESRFTVPAGAATFNNPLAVNGGGQHYTATNSLILGGIAGDTQWDLVTNTKVPYSTGSAPASGSFTVDTSYVTVTPSMLNAMCPAPTLSRLKSIWSW